VINFVSNLRQSTGFLRVFRFPPRYDWYIVVNTIPLTQLLSSWQHCNIEKFEDTTGETRRLKAKDRQHNDKRKRTKGQTCGTRRVTLVTNLVICYIVLFSLFLTFPLIICCASHLTELVFSISIIKCMWSMPHLDLTTSNI
jgi:hypothetical protein